MIHKSKVDLWLAAFLGLLPLVTVVVTASSAFAGDRPGIWIGTAAFALVLALYGGLIFPMSYEVGPEHLVIRHGLVRRRIPIAGIRGVKPSRNPLSSPALSLARLHVDYGSFLGVLISPRDRGAFLDDLAMVAPHLRREGDSLAPSGQ
ncbi:MAG: PH domain-containing protein [Planctomycetes bacterium]|nr:PH domain-containing protein [Planctomycetota bacterium]